MSIVLNGSGASADNEIPTISQASISQDFRPTLTSGVPVTAADVTAAATVYLTPYKGNRIGLWNGTTWVNYTSAEMSLAIGTLASATIPQDIFCYLDAGVPTLEKLAWTSTTARATALAYQDGILVKSGDATRRYIGSFAPTSTTTTEDSLANRYLWNYYHRVPRAMERLETTATWTSGVTGWRQARATAANQLNYFVGLLGDEVRATVNCSLYNNNLTSNQMVAVGNSSTTTPSGTYMGIDTPVVSKAMQSTAFFEGLPASLGVNSLVWLERVNTAGTATFQGVIANNCQSGIVGRVLA